MKISRATLDLLDNFSRVNDSIKVLPGNKIWVRSEDNLIVARASVAEDFPKQFQFFSQFAGLGKFLKIVKQFDDPDFDFQDRWVDITAGKYKTRFLYADAEAPIATTKKDPAENAFDWNFSMHIGADDLKKMVSIAAINGSPHVVFECEGNGAPIFIYGRDLGNKDTNTFSIETGSTSNEKFSIVTLLDHCKFVDGSYDVNVFFSPDAKLTNWNRKGDNDLRYFVSVDVKSTLG